MNTQTADRTDEKLHDGIRRMVAMLNEKTGLPAGHVEGVSNWSFGYIGNLTADGRDDRAWTVFAPHPGRPGQAHENLGYVSTDEVVKLRDRLVGVLYFLGATAGR